MAFDAVLFRFLTPEFQFTPYHSNTFHTIMTPVLSQTDYTLLRELIKNMPIHLRTREILPLSEELDKAGIVPDDQIEADIIRLGSEVEVRDVSSAKKIRFTLVLPPRADISKNRISILAPMGIAVIGFRQGHEIDWKMPSGLRRLRITEVINPSKGLPK